MRLLMPQDEQPKVRSEAVPNAGLDDVDSASGGQEAALLVRESVGAHAHHGENALWGDLRDRISYSSCNEDSRCEIRALEPGPGKRLFCVTAGGGRVLDLLAEGPDEIWAVDLNPSQNHLLELKIAGIRALSHAEYLGFLGVRPSADRLATFARLRPRLTPGAQHYFDSRKGMLKAGVLFQGNLERFLVRYIARLVRLARPFWVRRLMAATTLERQRPLLHETGTRLWRALISNLCRRRFLEWFSAEADFWRFVPREIPLHTRIVACIFDHLENHLARDNHLLSLIFNGRYTNEDALPAYLRPEPFERIRKALSHTRMRLVSGTVGDVLHQAPPCSIDGFALSDISAYLDDLSYRGLIEQVLRTARKGARLCSRGVLYHRDLPPECARRLQRDPELEQEFARDDASMVHAFMVGELK